VTDSRGQEKDFKRIFMQQEFLNIDEVANYLGVKPCTVYAWAEARRIPCYKFGRLLRFKKDEMDLWSREQKQDCVCPEKTARKVIKDIGRKKLNVGEIIRNSIDKEKQERYNNRGKPDRVKGLRKEVHDGSV
jgi:excisionase family DNA binding protein